MRWCWDGMVELMLERLVSSLLGQDVESQGSSLYVR